MSKLSPSSENDSGPGVTSAGLLTAYVTGRETDPASICPRGSSTLIDAGRIRRQHLEEPALGPK